MPSSESCPPSGAPTTPGCRRSSNGAPSTSPLFRSPLLAVSLVLAPQLTELLFGEGFDKTATILPILMIALVSIGYGTLAGFLAPVLGLQWRLTLYAGIGACVNVALNVVLIPKYGAVGSAWATVVTEILTMALLLGTCLLGLRLRLRAGPILATFASAGVMVLCNGFNGGHRLDTRVGRRWRHVRHGIVRASCRENRRAAAARRDLAAKSCGKAATCEYWSSQICTHRSWKAATNANALASSNIFVAIMKSL